MHGPAGRLDSWRESMIFLMARTVAVAIILTLCASPVVADSAHISAFVQQTRVTGDEAYGGCMAALSKSPKNMLPACKNTWVTFSCDGTYTDPVRAYRMLDQAQLALATGMRVLVFVTDEKMHDGFCLATRISVASE